MSQSTAGSREVDVSEYNPVVVELPPSPTLEAEKVHDANGVHDESADEGSTRGDDGGRGTLGDERWSEEKRTGLWVELLDKKKERFLAALNEEERQTFLNSLEI